MASTPVEVKKADLAGAPDIWQSFRSEMDRLFDRFGLGGSSLSRLFTAPPGFAAPALTLGVPAVEISEGKNAWRLTAELPGLSEKNVEVVLADDVLTLRGEKKQEREESGTNFHISERSYGSFTRSFVLPEGVDRTGIGAAFAKGVLTVTLPKKPDAQVEEKRIEVKATT